MQCPPARSGLTRRDVGGDSCPGKHNSEATRCRGCWTQNAPGVRYLALRDLLDLAPDDPELAAARRAAHRAGPIAAILDADGRGGLLGRARSGLPAQVPLHRLVGHPAGAAGRLDRRRRAHRPGLRLRPGACADPGRAVLDVRRALRHGWTACRATCAGRCSSWAATTPGWRRPSTGWRAASPARGSRPWTEREAPVRYYAGKCGPVFACGANNKLPCAWGAVKVMLALGRWPADRRTPVMRARHRAGRRLPAGHGSRTGRVSQRLQRQAERQLVEVRLPGLLRHRPAADRRGAGRAGLRPRPAPGPRARPHPREAGCRRALAAGVRLRRQDLGATSGRRSSPTRG